MNFRSIISMGLIAGLLLSLFSACRLQSYSDFEPDLYDGEFTWKEVSTDADWCNRFDHAAVSFKDKMWIIGGYNPGIISGDTYLEDVWSSEDGANWDLVNENAPWHGRRGHQVVNFNDGTGEALFLIGGFEVDESTGYRQYTNDVWKSSNGKDWQQIKENREPPVDSLYDWYPRMEHSCFVKEIDNKDYIYLVAGRSMRDSIDGRFSMMYHNDVWRSENAIEWERLDNTDYGIRGDQAYAINPNTGRMYIQGGTHGYVFSSENFSTHPIEKWEYLWYSDDGINWIAENDTSAMDQTLLWRSSHKMIHYKDAIWAFPGKTTSNEHYLFAKPDHYPIWRYGDNEEWSVDSYGAAFDPRHGYECVVFKDKVWILGGFTSNMGQSNDVWSGEIK
jgi:hypothetical protein